MQASMTITVPSTGATIDVWLVEADGFNNLVGAGGCAYSTATLSGLNDALTIASGGSPAGGAHVYSVPTITVNSNGSLQAFLVDASSNVIAFSSGTLTQASSDGVCTFGNLQVGAPGTYTIAFALLGMPLVYTNSFVVT